LLRCSKNLSALGALLRYEQVLHALAHLCQGQAAHIAAVLTFAAPPQAVAVKNDSAKSMMTTSTTEPELSTPAAISVSSAPVPAALQHGRYEDVQAMFSGSLFVGIAMMMYAQAGLLTGSTAGLAFVLHYATGWSFGGIYFAITISVTLVGRSA